MNQRMLTDLLRRLARLEASSPFRTGVVTSTSPLSVALGGSEVPYASVDRLASYTPTVNDVVEVVLIGGPVVFRAIIQGKIVVAP